MNSSAFILRWLLCLFLKSVLSHIKMNLLPNMGMTYRYIYYTLFVWFPNNYIPKCNKVTLYDGESLLDAMKIPDQHAYTVCRYREYTQCNYTRPTKMQTFYLFIGIALYNIQTITTSHVHCQRINKSIRLEPYTNVCIVQCIIFIQWHIKNISWKAFSYAVFTYLVGTT